VAISYKNQYNNDGNGCASFIDVDEKQYLYTQFEAYEANKVFPCFDQPDLKAKMKLSAIIPPSWKKILSN
jgi:aminopeptidase N